MSVLKAGLLPHPPLVIPEIGKDEVLKVQSTINALNEFAKELSQEEPDLLISISPHGPVFRDAVNIIDKAELHGSFSEFGHPEIEFTEKTDQNFISHLVDNANTAGIRMIALSDKELNNINHGHELDHGVLVPLYYLRKAGIDASLVPLTMGLLDYDRLYKLGEIIANTAEQLDKKIVVIASGDLSHRLKPGAPAGFNPHGQEFDDKIIDLLQKKKFTELLTLDKNLIEKAGECGLRPLIIMIGTFSDKEVDVDVKSYEGPFGVGYGIVSIKIKS